MRVLNTVYNSQKFGRAFTTEEKEDYKKLIKDARKQLELKNTTAIVFDFNVPSEEGYNLGMGSTFSDSMLYLTDFIHDMSGITSIQSAPQGRITLGNISPYSGTNFAMGEHLIDLQRLTTPEFGEILEEADIKKANAKYPGNREELEHRADYQNIMGTDDKIGVQYKLLRMAYKNYLVAMAVYDQNIGRLNYDFEQFKEKNNYWLEPDTIYKILSQEYETDDFTKWDNEDKFLYSERISEQEREQRIGELKENYPDFIEYETFKQFLAYKQLQDYRDELHYRNIKLYGDCLLGFSPAEIWSNIDCFKRNLYYGGPDENCPETNNIQVWGLNALDYSQLGDIGKDGDKSNLGKTGVLLYKKFQNFLSRYDGLRLDAAWQYITPFLYTETDYDYEKVDVPELNERIIKIINQAAKDLLGRKYNIYNPSQMMLELIGSPSERSKELTKNKYPHIYTTSYAECGETLEHFKQQGYDKSKFYIGIGNHDNDTLVNIANNEKKRKKQIEKMRNDYNFDISKLAYKSGEYLNQNEENREKENFRNAKFAEIFSTSKQFFTLLDMFGMQERINIAGKVSDGNWKIRIPKNYEEFYHSQLSNGYGLNVPKALEGALYMSHINNPKLTAKLQQAAEILRQKGPNTEVEANEADKNGELKKKFEYNC